MIKNRKLVIASRNEKKVEEFSYLLKDFPIELETLDKFPSIPIVEEDGYTFDENAYKKANFTARTLGIPSIADDSGLVIPALDGAPGVHSARYAGSNSSDFQNCNKVLQKLKNCSDRKAYFQCVLSIAVPGGKALTYEGKCYGQITDRMFGKNGFGYDSIFLCDKFKKTFAQLSFEEKNRVSHRGIALRILRKEFVEILSWIDLQV